MPMKPFTLLCAVVLAACGDADPVSPPPRDDVGEAGVFAFHLDLDQAVPVGVIDATLTITRDGAPVTGAYVWVEAKMPSHTHTSAALRAEEIGDGRYAIDGLEVEMPGDWELALDAEAGGARDSIEFDVFVE